jgi:tetratricopeptide (TPR) repeat protein
MRAHLERYQAISAADPQNRATLEDLARGYISNCALERRALRLDVADRMCGNALTVFRRHTEQDPRNMSARDALANALVEQGRVWSTQGRWHEAREVLVEGLAVARGLVKEDPAAGRWQEDLVLALTGLAHAELGLGRIQQARAYAQEGLDAAIRIASQRNQTTAAQGSVARLQILLGDASSARGDAARTVDHYDAALRTLEPLVQQSPGVVQWRADLAEARAKRSRVAFTLGDVDGARIGREQARLVLDELERQGTLLPEDARIRDSLPRAIIGPRQTKP